MHDCVVGLSGNDLLERHLVFAQLQSVVLWIFAQQFQQSARNNQLAGCHSAHVNLPFHAVDEAGQRLSIEALQQLLPEVLNLDLAGEALNGGCQLVELLVSEGLESFN